MGAGGVGSVGVDLMDRQLSSVCWLEKDRKAGSVVVGGHMSDFPRTVPMM